MSVNRDNLIGDYERFILQVGGHFLDTLESPWQYRPVRIRSRTVTLCVILEVGASDADTYIALGNFSHGKLVDVDAGCNVWQS